jgi:hypothetical protein
MDERVKFIARMLDGEAMSRLCEGFSIARKTGARHRGIVNVPAERLACPAEALPEGS